MIALTAVSDGSVFQTQIQTNKAVKEARDFIAAVTLRTAILRMFDKPLATLGMLKRFNKIQQALAGRLKRSEKRCQTSIPRQSMAKS